MIIIKVILFKAPMHLSNAPFGSWEFVYRYSTVENSDGLLVLKKLFVEPILGTEALMKLINIILA